MTKVVGILPLRIRQHQLIGKGSISSRKWVYKALFCNANNIKIVICGIAVNTSMIRHIVLVDSLIPFNVYHFVLFEKVQIGQSNHGTY